MKLVRKAYCAIALRGLRIGSVLLFVLAGQAQVQGKPSDWCLPGTGTTVLAVDVTTRLTERDKEVLAQGVQRIVAGLGAGERFTILTLSDAPANSRTLLDQCLPGCSDEASGLLGSCLDVRIQRNELPAFVGAINESLARLASEPGTSSSAIIASLSFAMRPFREQLNAVYIFSDMLERSNEIDLLSAAKSGKEPTAVLGGRDYGKALEAAFNSAPVVIFGFGVEDSVHGPADIGTLQFVEAYWRSLLGGYSADNLKFLLELR